MSSSTVLVGFNDSPAANAALAWATAAAQRLDAELAVTWVLPSAVAWELAAVQISPDKRRHQMKRRLREACASHCDPAGVPYGWRVVEGSPTAILRRDGSRPEVVLMVVGASHRGAIGDLVVGSVAHDLAHDSPTPVVVVPSPSVGTQTRLSETRSPVPVS